MRYEIIGSSSKGNAIVVAFWISGSFTGKNGEAGDVF